MRYDDNIANAAFGTSGDSVLDAAITDDQKAAAARQVEDWAVREHVSLGTVAQVLDALGIGEAL